MIKYFIIFVIAAIISFAATPFVKKLAFKLNAIDVPNSERRVHKKPIPRMGGLAMYISFVIVSLGFYGANKQVIGIIIGATILVVMGIIDDRQELPPLYKLIAQIAAGVVLIIFGITVKSITVPFMNEYLYIGYWGIPITLIWVVGITNAINLIDGLDGLACGISFISSTTLFGVALISQRDVAIILTLILSGACLGFLYYNFNPASIFMGDTGSQFLGFVLSAISIQGAIKSVTTVAVVVPILAIGLPIYDTLFAMLRRKLNNKPMMSADRGHLHHKLLDRGLSQKRTVILMYIISMIMGLLSIIAMLLPTKTSFMLFMFVCFFAYVFGRKIGILRQE